MMKKGIAGILCFLLLASCAGCFGRANGKIEYAHVSMAIDETDLYAYAGAVDYIFIGTVKHADDTSVSYDNDKSTFTLLVTENLKGKLVGEVQVKKTGGYLWNGTLLLYASDRIQDTGLPMEGKRYIFMAYGQQDGSLMLSEFHGSVPYEGEAQREKYLGYIRDAKPSERKRFPSKYEAAPQGSVVSASETLRIFGELTADKVQEVRVSRLPDGRQLKLAAGDKRLEKITALLKSAGNCESLPGTGSETTGLCLTLELTLTDQSKLTVIAGEKKVLRLNGTRFLVETDPTDALDALLFPKEK